MPQERITAHVHTHIPGSPASPCGVTATGKGERAPVQEPWPSLSREGPSKMPLKNAHEPNHMLPLCPHPSVESHSVVMMFLETPCPSVGQNATPPNYSIWAACKEVGRADDNMELKLPNSQVLAGWLLNKSLQRARLTLLHPQHTRVTSPHSGRAHHCLLTFPLLCL